MNITELASLLRERDSGDPARMALIDRLVRATEGFDAQHPLGDELPCFPRYLGSGPWLEAVKADRRRQS